MRQPETPEPKRQNSGCLVAIIVILLIILGAVIISSISDAPPPVPVAHTETPTPMLTEKVTISSVSATYEYGVIVITGIAINSGDATLYSPTIVLDIYDSSGTTKLDQQVTWPAGWYLNNVPPGQRAAFEFYSVPPGKPTNIKFSISCKEYPFEVVK